MKIVITVEIPEGAKIPQTADDISELFYAISDGQVRGDYTLEKNYE